MTNPLTIASTVGPTAAPRTTTISPGQALSRQTLSGLARMYRGLDIASQGLWQTAANQLNATGNRTGKQRLTANTAFSNINSARIAAQMDIITQPNLPVVGPVIFPALTLTAATVGSEFTLTLSTPRPITTQICVQAAPPAYTGKPHYALKSFRPAGVIGGMLGSRNITDLYTALYGTPPVGAVVVLRIFAVSDSGVRGDAIVVSTVYQAAAGEDAVPGGDSADAGLRKAA